MSDYISVENLKQENVYNTVIAAFMGSKIIKETIKEDNKDKIVFKIDPEFEKDDSIKNLALLQGHKNSQLNNKLYPEKRQYIADYENSARKETAFVPICTRNVFFKHYSPNSINPLIWDNAAGTEYLNAIINTIANYLELETIQESENKNNKIGLKIKTGVKL